MNVFMMTPLAVLIVLPDPLLTVFALARKIPQCATLPPRTCGMLKPNCGVRIAGFSSVLILANFCASAGLSVR